MEDALEHVYKMTKWGIYVFIIIINNMSFLFLVFIIIIIKISDVWSSLHTLSKLLCFFYLGRKGFEKTDHLEIRSEFTTLKPLLGASVVQFKENDEPQSVYNEALTIISLFASSGINMS